MAAVESAAAEAAAAAAATAEGMTDDTHQRYLVSIPFQYISTTLADRRGRGDVAATGT